MDAFIQKFCEKYSLPIALSLQLLDNMEKFTFHKGDFLVQEGGRNSNFYIVSKGIWRGHYLNDGVDVSVWFVFMVLCLLGLPLLLKVPGIWLAVPLAEILTFLVIMVIYYRKHQWVRR